MIRLHKPLLIAIFLVVSFICAASAQPADSSSKLDTENDHDLSVRASRVLNGVMEGLAEGDYNKFTRDFSSTMRKSQDREGFLQLQRRIQKSLGKLRSTEFIGSYHQQGAVITLFKARFSKDKDDVLIKLVFDGRSASQVTGLWFDSPALE